ncbi:YggT family protein [Bartonella sp. DGB2]|uniref:YggT family protein n=1 Tax=Bartonella sp. DGB2 TaxID=3388426 RepID=UPI003990232D
MIYALLSGVDTVLNLYVIILIANVVFSWLYSFQIINPYNKIVRLIGRFLYQACEPILMPIRRILPDLGPIDISPMVAFFIIHILRIFMWRIYAGFYF